MKTIIAGSRTVKRKFTVLDAMNFCGWDITEVVSGGADGVDKIGEALAIDSNIPVKRFPADWSQYGKAAGPIRNRQMAAYADALIAVWDGKSRGTANMIKEAKKAGLTVYVYEVKLNEGR